jgi:hypothetical protein
MERLVPISGYSLPMATDEVGASAGLEELQLEVKGPHVGQLRDRIIDSAEEHTIGE